MLHDTKTNFIKSEHSNRRYVLIDAEHAVLGRLASYVASMLMGKHKTCVTKSNLNGDAVIIINAEKIALTSNKMRTKMHMWHTGFIGGLKKISIDEQIKDNKADEVIKRAVKGMLAKGPLGYKMLSNLYVYNGAEHPHASQKPIIVDFLGKNVKNNIKRGLNA